MIKQVNRVIKHTKISFVLKTIFFAVVLVVSGGGYASDNAITSSIDAFLVHQNSQNQEELLAADRVVPGDVIEYQLSYENVSNEAVTDLILSGAIPSKTEFIEEKSTQIEGLQFQARSLVSVEPNVFSAPPLLREEKDENGEIQLVEIYPEQYDQIRWLVLDELESGEKLELSYRVKVSK